MQPLWKCDPIYETELFMLQVVTVLHSEQLSREPRKKYSGFPDIDSRTVNQKQGPSESEAHVTAQVTCL